VSSDDIGNFLTWVRHPNTKTINTISYASLFNSHGAIPQLDVDLESTKPKVPRRPTQLSFGPTSVLSYLMKFGTSMTGENVDALRETSVFVSEVIMGLPFCYALQLQVQIDRNQCIRCEPLPSRRRQEMMTEIPRGRHRLACTTASLLHSANEGQQISST
jgi:hypothetical protein